MIGRGLRGTRKKPAPVPLCPPQTPLRAYVTKINWLMLCMEMNADYSEYRKNAINAHCEQN
jgi:hypothetical protein